MGNSLGVRFANLCPCDLAGMSFRCAILQALGQYFFKAGMGVWVVQ